IVWGVWHGVFLIVEHAGLGDALERAWRPLRHSYALAAVVGGWVLFRCDTLSHAGAYYASLGGGGAPTQTKFPLLMYLDPLVATTLAVAVIGATPVGRALGHALDRTAPTQRWTTLGLCGEWLWLALVLIASCSALAAGTYNPFIYFRF
ncbi:MAG TPA: MBOAT family protein, partial [Casimicrobiaceae bacterium]